MVRIESYKLAFFIEVNLSGPPTLDRLETAIEFVAKHLAHRVQLAIAVRRECLIDRARAAAATADEADLQLSAIRLAKGD